MAGQGDSHIYAIHKMPELHKHRCARDGPGLRYTEADGNGHGPNS